MNEPFDIITPDGKHPVLPEDIIIDIHVDLYAGALPPQQVLPSVMPGRMGVRPKFAAAFKNILSLPKPIGRLVFDLLGRHDTADSSSVLLGWFVVLIGILLLRGFIPLDMLINWLVGRSGF